MDHDLFSLILKIFPRFFFFFFLISSFSFLIERFVLLGPTKQVFFFHYFVVINHPDGVADRIMYENVKCCSSEFAIWYCKLVTRIYYNGFCTYTSTFLFFI